MANYPKELTDLVNEYLTDGIISSKERQVLLKKATALGVDADEFDLYIDAQQQKADQVIDNAAAKKRGATCPYCGAPVQQLAEKCPECGQHITAEASEELLEIIDKLEESLIEFKAGRDTNRNKAIVEKYSRRARMYYSGHPKIKAILAEVENEILSAESAARKKALIQGTLKNKWFWCGALIVIGLVFGLLAISGLFAHDTSFALSMIAFLFVFFGIAGIFLTI